MAVNENYNLFMLFSKNLLLNINPDNQLIDFIMETFQ